MFKGIIKFFDRLEDEARHSLSHRPVVYALITGFGVVLFWSGIERFVDKFSFFTPEVSIVVSVLILLLTGTFVSFFIGEQIILSGLKSERRQDQKTLDEIKKEEERIRELRHQIAEIHKTVAELKRILEELQQSTRHH